MFLNASKRLRTPPEVVVHVVIFIGPFLSRTFTDDNDNDDDNHDGCNATITLEGGLTINDDDDDKDGQFCAQRVR